MSSLVIFNKPFHVLSQFTDKQSTTEKAKPTDKPRLTLAKYIDIKGVYPAGRLDFDSEGLLLLTDDGDLQAKISHPKYKLPKTYWVQVEGAISQQSIDDLAKGVILKDGMTRAAKVKCIDEPTLWPRVPPVRHRENIPTSWLEIIITEGRNRQVRRMTAAVGHPTLRLVRYRIGTWDLNKLKPGEYRTERIHVNKPVAATQYKTKRRKNHGK